LRRGNAARGIAVKAIRRKEEPLLKQRNCAERSPDLAQPLALISALRFDRREAGGLVVAGDEAVATIPREPLASLAGAVGVHRLRWSLGPSGRAISLERTPLAAPILLF
jgi:hypothetical protein